MAWSRFENHMIYTDSFKGAGIIKIYAYTNTLKSASTLKVSTCKSAHIGTF